MLKPKIMNLLVKKCHDLPFSVPLPASGKSLSPLAKQSSPSYKLFGFCYGVVEPLPQVKNLTQGRLSLAFYESPARLPICLLTQKHAVDQSQRMIFLITVFPRINAALK